MMEIVRKSSQVIIERLVVSYVKFYTYLVAFRYLR